jgi:hypothetical protein
MLVPSHEILPKTPENMQRNKTSGQKTWSLINNPKKPDRNPLQDIGKFFSSGTQHKQPVRNSPTHDLRVWLNKLDLNNIIKHPNKEIKIIEILRTFSDFYKKSQEEYLQARLKEQPGITGDNLKALISKSDEVVRQSPDYKDFLSILTQLVDIIEPDLAESINKQEPDLIKVMVVELSKNNPNNKTIEKIIELFRTHVEKKKLFPTYVKEKTLVPAHVEEKNLFTDQEL